LCFFCFFLVGLLIWLQGVSTRSGHKSSRCPAAIYKRPSAHEREREFHVVKIKGEEENLSLFFFSLFLPLRFLYSYSPQSTWPLKENLTGCPFIIFYFLLFLLFLFGVSSSPRLYIYMYVYTWIDIYPKERSSTLNPSCKSARPTAIYTTLRTLGEGGPPRFFFF
jgi:sterol desaturase/sphingolipid hydroxylase (fatty acid hydroxylase superfamily)